MFQSLSASILLVIYRSRHIFLKVLHQHGRDIAAKYHKVSVSTAPDTYRRIRQLVNLLNLNCFLRDLLCWMVLTLVTVLSLFLATAVARTVLELQGVSFELALTSYKYAAILFYDSSTTGQTLIEQLLKSAEGFTDTSDIHVDGEIAMVL